MSKAAEKLVASVSTVTRRFAASLASLVVVSTAVLACMPSSTSATAKETKTKAKTMVEIETQGRANLEPPAPALVGQRPPANSESARSSSGAADSRGEGLEVAEKVAEGSQVASEPTEVRAVGVDDPRRARAATQCVDEDTRAVIVRGEELLPVAGVAAAIAAVADGDFVWLCPGGHTSEAALVMEARSRVTIAGSGVILVGNGWDPALEIRGGAEIRLRGLKIGVDSYEDEPIEALKIADVRGLVIEDCGFASEYGTALALRDVRAAQVVSSRFVGSAIGVSAVAGDVTVSESRFVGNAKNLAGDLAKLEISALGEGNQSSRAGRRAAKRGRTRRAPKLDPGEFVDLAAIFPEERTFPVLTWKDGQDYAVLDTVLTPVERPKGPGCEVDEEGQTMECSEAIPFRRALPEGLLRSAFASLTAITETGPCALKVGAPVILDTSGCEPSIALAVPLSGCDDYAPLVTSGSPPAELHWVPRTATVGDFGLKSLPAKLRPWLVKQLRPTLVDLGVLRTLLGSDLSRYSGVAEWAVELAKERWQSRVAGFQIVLSECEAWTPIYVESVVVPRGGKKKIVGVPQEVVVSSPWVGVLEVGGRLVAFISRGELMTGLLIREPGGEFTMLHEIYHSIEHDECLVGEGPVAFGMLCGP